MVTNDKGETHLWKQPNFLKLWFSQSFNSISHILLQVVVMVQVYQKTNSAAGSASVLALMSLSLFISGLFAAKYIDHFSMKSIIYIAGWTRAILTVLIGLFLFVEQPWGLVGLFLSLVCLSFINAWYQPARFALLPLIITSDLYIKANATLVTIQQLLMTAGWGISGFLVVYVEIPILIFIVCILHILSGLLVKLIKIENQHLNLKKTKKKRSAWKEVWSIPVVRGITIMNIIESFSNAIWTSALLLSFATLVLKEGEVWWGLLNAGYFLGAIIGSITVTLNSKILSSRIGIMIGLSGLSMGLFTILFSLNTLPFIAVILTILMGPLYQARSICQVSLLQISIPENKRASIMAARNSFLTPLSGITVLLVGFMADLFGIQTTYFIAGVLYLLASLVAFQQKSLRNYRFEKKNQCNQVPS
ncbi:MFS transporter [Ferdinandcohnia sp. SAFN-114]|uniref:MFS transporter n=1 Tax=Ferdinandcohnia sp. SAFN-114 TaxID=3387275 RepID=UPI003F7D3271